MRRKGQEETKMGNGNRKMRGVEGRGEDGVTDAGMERVKIKNEEQIRVRKKGWKERWKWNEGYNKEELKQRRRWIGEERKAKNREMTTYKLANKGKISRNV